MIEKTGGAGNIAGYDKPDVSGKTKESTAKIDTNDSFTTDIKSDSGKWYMGYAIKEGIKITPKVAQEIDRKNLEIDKKIESLDKTIKKDTKKALAGIGLTIATGVACGLGMLPLAVPFIAGGLTMVGFFKASFGLGRSCDFASFKEHNERVKSGEKGIISGAMTFKKVPEKIPEKQSEPMDMAYLYGKYWT